MQLKTTWVPPMALFDFQIGTLAAQLLPHFGVPVRLRVAGANCLDGTGLNPKTISYAELWQLE